MHVTVKALWDWVDLSLCLLAWYCWGKLLVTLVHSSCGELTHCLPHVEEQNASTVTWPTELGS